MTPVPAPQIDDLSVAEPVLSTSVGAMDLLNTYAPVFAVAFVVALLLTPIVRRVAVAANIIDHPDETRKTHAYPVAYLGGVAVFFAVIVGLGVSYLFLENTPAHYAPVPIAIVIGMVAIMFTGLADDVWGWDPRLKVAGQLVAAAALAIDDVGVRVAEGAFRPLLGGADEILFSAAGFELLNSHLYYWVGTALIAVFVLGGANAANFLDGLDGLLSGTVATIAVGLLAISVLMAVAVGPVDIETATPTLAGARIVVCMALLGAVLGFLPHNFNPAAIFLGDCGSLLLGYLCVAVILMLGEYGQTHLVFAGLIVFSVPIIDTTLAIIRRLLAGTPMSSADDQHVHHQLLRALGSVKKAVLCLYGLSILFGAIGVTLAALVMFTALRVRVMYAVAVVLFSFIGVFAVKSARRQQWSLGAASASSAAPPAPESGPRREDGTDGRPSPPVEGQSKAPARS
ncbi:MAG: glycosyltransferase family 4 protein [Planctomycetota bacterium]|jgi:UDP-GlcNAc:undecaprenyl-phosphate GlcNAc-1-phosphate transferase